jgi:nucleoside-diphosphate-sugar epimerase
VEVDLQPIVLVTGAAGYIGSVLVGQLLERGFRVRAVDNLRYGGESLLRLFERDEFEFIHADVRDDEAMANAIAGVWGVVHLAAIVGDPACRNEPELAVSVNLDATKRLYQAANAGDVQRFVFASTCSNYGKMSDQSQYVDEESDLKPVSLYAETKVAVEQHLLQRPRSTPCKPTSLRFATVYGLSPRMRFDLTVNEFTRDVAVGKELVVFGEQFWRPYCHVRDLARSVTAVLEAPEEKVEFEVFNVGDTNENFRKGSIVELIREQVPTAKVRYVHRDEDPRDYRVSFAKINSVLGYEVSRRVPDGIREVRLAVGQGVFTDPFGVKYGNTSVTTPSVPI